MEVTTSKFSAASEVLKKLVENKNENILTKHEIILLLKNEILTARDSGNSWRDISKALKGVDIEISSQHIKACCQTIPKKFVKKEKTAAMSLSTLQAESTTGQSLEQVATEQPDLQQTENV